MRQETVQDSVQQDFDLLIKKLDVRRIVTHWENYQLNYFIQIGFSIENLISCCFSQNMKENFNFVLSSFD